MSDKEMPKFAEIYIVLKFTLKNVNFKLRKN